jgi:FkbM family methyltransferase
MTNTFKEVKEKLKLIGRVKAHSIPDQIKLALVLLRYWLYKRNMEIDIIVDVDGVKYKLVDLESLFIVSPHYEEWIWRHLRPRLGDVFVDVGAHVGKYALRIAKLIGNKGKVIAIEPHPKTFGALLFGIKINQLANVVAFNVAAWDKKCRLRLYLGEPDRKSSSIGLLGMGISSLKREVGTSNIEVFAKPLDDIINELELQRVNWVKIDVEGCEWEVLQGSLSTIKRFKPRIIVECGEKRGAILNLMRGLGYTSTLIAPSYFYFYPH